MQQLFMYSSSRNAAADDGQLTIEELGVSHQNRDRELEQLKRDYEAL